MKDVNVNTAYQISNSLVCMNSLLPVNHLIFIDESQSKNKQMVI